MADLDPPPPPSPLSRFLSVFAEVRPGEAASVLLLTLDVFLLLTAYYFLKTIREPYILENPGGAELKSYAGGAQALLLIFVVFGYNALVKRLGRMQLAAVVGLFFIANLVLFSVLGRFDLPHMGTIFFVWVGVFNMTAISQFWAFANDCYDPGQGKRLFVIVAFGGSAGSLAGAYLAGRLYAPLGRYDLMLAAAAVLLVCVGITYVVHRIELSRPRPEGAPKVKADAPVAEMNAEGAFTMIARDRYLLLIALLTLVLNWETSTGEYILDRELTVLAAERSAAGIAKAAETIAVFKANYFLWINAAGMLAQLFAVSRLLRYVDVRGALLLSPLIGLFGYGVVVAAPVVAVVRLARIFEKTSDYSLQATVNKVLFLPASRAAKYGAQLAIGSVVVRIGDMLSSGVTYLGTQKLAFTTRSFALVNLGLIGVWLLVAVFLGRANQAITRRRAEEAAATVFA